MDYQQWDPFSSPAWPWIVAQQLQDSQFRISTVRQHCGEWIARAVEHLRTQQHNHPEISAARELVEAGTRERDELEARLLAGHSDQQISERMDLLEPVVAAYASLFFAVRGRLNASGWIRNQAIGWPGIGRPLPLGVFLKYMAYYSGEVVLEGLLPVLRRIAEAMTGGNIDTLRAIDPTVASVYRVIQLLSLEISDKNAWALFQAHLQLMRVKRDITPGTLHDCFTTSDEYQLYNQQPIACPDVMIWADAAA
jgi:hypothetical protein